MGRGCSDKERNRSRSGPATRRRWTDQRILAELRQFVRGRETFPTRREFEVAGRRTLWNAIRDRGGVTVWAPRADLPLREAQRRRGLSEDEAVRQAQRVVAELGTLPGATQLRRLGYPKLATYIYFAGGAKRFCLRHGLRLPNG